MQDNNVTVLRVNADRRRSLYTVPLVPVFRGGKFLDHARQLTYTLQYLEDTRGGMVLLTWESTHPVRQNEREGRSLGP